MKLDFIIFFLLLAIVSPERGGEGAFEDFGLVIRAKLYSETAICEAYPCNTMGYLIQPSKKSIITRPSFLGSWRT